VSRGFSHEAKAGEVAWLALDLLILLWAGGVIAGEVKVTKSSTRSGHDLLELLLLLAPEVVLLLFIALAVVILLNVVILVGGVEILPLEAVGDEVGGVTALEAAPRRSPLSLQNLCKAQSFLTNRAISLSGMLSYCSSEPAIKENKANSKLTIQWCWWG
jgi:hypothetical protein